MTKCKLRSRKDDIPKYGKEKSWVCDTCGVVCVAAKKPTCMARMQGEIDAIEAQVEATTHPPETK